MAFFIEVNVFNKKLKIGLTKPVDINIILVTDGNI